MDIKHLLQVIAAEIREDEAALSKKRDAYEFLLKRSALNEEPVTSSSPSASPAPPVQGLAHAAPPAESLYENVLKAVQEVYEREFTAGDVYSVLADRGVKFNTTTPKASIATVLGRLVQSGVLKMTFKGSGKIPNRFQKATQPTDDLP